jgi:hypothetical protein
MMFRSALTLINHIYIYYLSHSVIDLLVHHLNFQSTNQTAHQANPINQPNSPPNQPNLCYGTGPQFMLQYSIIFATVSHPFLKFWQIFFKILSVIVTQSFFLQWLDHFYYSDSVIFRYRRSFFRFRHALYWLGHFATMTRPFCYDNLSFFLFH